MTSKFQRLEPAFRAMFAQGSSLEDAARVLNCTPSGLRHYCLQWRIDCPSPPGNPSRCRLKTPEQWLADPRHAQMVHLYRQGLTLQKIGAEFGVSRERVRQIVKACGAARVGVEMRSTVRSAHLQRQRAATAFRILTKWGVDQATHKELRQSGVIRGWEYQRRNSHTRGIVWDLPFPEWLAIWQASGKLHLRGRGKDRYCMSRIRDEGGYVLGNVHIQLNTENGREAVKKWKGKTKPIRGVYCLYPGRERAWLARVGKVSLGFYATAQAANDARLAYFDFLGRHHVALTKEAA